MIELKSCPFCRGNAEVDWYTSPINSKKKVYLAGCSDRNDCLVVPRTRGASDSEKGVMSDWNKRAECPESEVRSDNITGHRKEKL